MRELGAQKKSSPWLFLLKNWIHVIFSFIFLHLILYSFTFVGNARKAFISLFNNNIIMHRVKYDFSKKKIELLKVLLAKELCTSTSSCKTLHFLREFFFFLFLYNSNLWLCEKFLNFFSPAVIKKPFFFQDPNSKRSWEFI